MRLYLCLGNPLQRRAKSRQSSSPNTVNYLSYSPNTANYLTKKKQQQRNITNKKINPNNITTNNNKINNADSNKTSESRQRATSAPKSPTLAVPICALPASQRLNPLLKKHGIVQQEIFFIFMLTGAGWQSLRSREESRGRGWRRW